MTECCSVSLSLCFTNVHIPAAARKAIGSACFECGTIGKSGKTSCCGHGGTWFRNCGSVGSAKLDHTWVEGIQACKARSRSKRGIDQQRNSVYHNSIDYSNGTDLVISEALAAAVQKFAFADASITTLAKVSTTTSARMPTIPPISLLMTGSVLTSVRTSIAAEGYDTILCCKFYIGLFLIIVIE